MKIPRPKMFAPNHIWTATCVALILLVAGCTSLTPAPDSELLVSLIDNAVTAFARTREGTLWYGIDQFDSIGGVNPSQQPQGLYRRQGTHVMHYPLASAIRTIEAGPDGAIYVGAECGVIRVWNDRIEPLAAVAYANSAFTMPIFPYDMDFAPDGTLWVAGVHALAHFTDESWIELERRRNG